MQRLEIPKIFEEILNSEHRAQVENIVIKFQDILKDNKLDFFTEYTDHGLEHIQSVLSSAQNIISNESFTHLKSKDIAVLIISIILHDLGMHINSEGLKKILAGENDLSIVKEFDSKTWEEEWKYFFHEAKRLNDDQLKNIFGSAEVDLKEPDLNTLDDYTRRIYGEFLRKKHHRLAHEIALAGFPTQIGSENILLTLNGSISNEILNISGLIARSHGMSIRDTFDYLKDSYQEAWKIPYDIKIIYLMVVLRISDYIQIDKERAPEILLKTKKIKSPISRQEWEKHNAIEHISTKTDDPERIFVLAQPKNSNIYLELKSLFSEIQYEFDLSWAILGEAYGKDEELRNLKLKYRRIKSNLDNKKKFTNTINYIPEKISFNADPELLKLLIGPLYGEDPKYGIRELLQNSVDAIEERAYLNSNFKDENLSISIQLSKDNPEEYILVVSDNGIGMREETIINYFFKAGASFRKSMVWKKNFIAENEIQIQKTGRFGVGVLAVFLLGDEFEMTTRYYSKSTGFYCKASLSTKQVELLRTDCNIGTTITIPLKQEINKLLKNTVANLGKTNVGYTYYNLEKNKYLEWFNWYCFTSPKINYNIHESLDKIFIFSDNLISNISKIPSNGWYNFTTKDFKSIHWSIDYRHISDSYKYGYLRTSESNTLICNGFIIPKGYKISKFSWQKPKISIFDSNGKMPLSLNRDYIQNDYLPFEEELIFSICRLIIQELLRINFVKSGNHYIPTKHEIEFDIVFDLSKYVIVKDSHYTLMDPYILQESKIDRIFQLWLNDAFTEDDSIFTSNEVAYQAFKLTNDPNYFYKKKLDRYYFDEPYLDEWFSLGTKIERKDSAQHAFILKTKYLYMLKKNRLRKYYKDVVKSKPYSQKYEQLTYIERKESYGFINLNSLSKTENLNPNIQTKFINQDVLDNGSYFLIKEAILNKKELPDTLFFKHVWKKLLGENYLIPIATNLRPVL